MVLWFQEASLRLVKQAGFVVNVAKCKWTSSQQGTWLGFDIDLHLGRISVPQEKIVTLKTQLGQAAQKPHLQAKF